MTEIYAALVAQGFSFLEALSMIEGISKAVERLGIDPWEGDSLATLNDSILELTEDDADIISGPDLR
jgi:hypothetical protein